jgi:TAG lipase / steryl ester hydrolase / phospholipase A2 / LPA acyltransferase
MQFKDLNIDWEELLNSLLKFVEKGVKLSVDYVPMIETFMLDSLDAMFAPRQILRQVGLIFGIQFVLLAYNSIYTTSRDLLSFLTAKGRKRKHLLDQLNTAPTYAEWKKIAMKIDEMNGDLAWREHDDSFLCDYRMIKKRIYGTLNMLERGDIFDLMFRVRGGLARDQFGIQHEGLFSKALSGPKYVIEKYHETMAMALNYICDSAISDEEVIILII